MMRDFAIAWTFSHNLRSHHILTEDYIKILCIFISKVFNKYILYKEKSLGQKEVFFRIELYQLSPEATVLILDL